jgi:putative peptidoglycan lipid II flippase
MLANTILVAVSYFASRLLGLVRETIIANQFGTDPVLDAYRASFGIIDLIYIVIAGGALGSAFIPVFSGFLAKNQPDDAWRLASGVLNIALLGLSLACLVIALLAEPIVALTVGRGFDSTKQALTVDLLRVMLFQPFLLGLGALNKATLESFDKFSLPALGSNLYNLGIIAGALAAPWLGIQGLVWGVNFGALLFLLVQLPGLRQVGARYLRPDAASADSDEPQWLGVTGLRQVFVLLGPRLIGQAAWQVNLIAIASFASTLGDGAVAANTYALQLMLLPHGLLALSVATVLFPEMARQYALGALGEVQRIATGAIRSIIFFGLFCSILLSVLGVPIVRLLFERGRFDALSTSLTSEALIAYAFGLAAFAAAEIIVRTFYAMQDTMTPVVVGIMAVVVNISGGWWLLGQQYGIAGLAFAFSVANIFEASVLLLVLGRRLTGLGRSFWWALLRMLLAAVFAGAVLFGLRWLSSDLVPTLLPGSAYRWPADFPTLALWTMPTSALGALSYLGLAWMLRLSEPQALLARVFGRFRRPKNTEGA